MDEENTSKDGASAKDGFLRRAWLRVMPRYPIPEERQVSPEANANFFSLLTFSWMSSIMAAGYQRPLELNDIWLVNPKRRTRDLASKFKMNFEEFQHKGTKRPLARALYKTFKGDFLLGALAAVTSSLVQVLIPFVVKYIIAFAAEDYEARLLGLPSPPIGRGVGLVLGITAMQILGSIGYNHFFYRGMLLGGQVRSALIAMIFDKAMTISGRAKAGGKIDAPSSDVKPGSEEEKEHFKKQLSEKGGKKPKDDGPEAWSSGRIVNLMSVDTSRIDQACGWFHMGWSAPLGLIVTIALLLVNLSYSALVGIALFFIATPLMALIVKSMMKHRGRTNKNTDERITMTQEVLQAIRFVKFYAWEADFLSRLYELRKKEIRGIRFLLSHRNVAIAMGSSIPIFSSMLTFITYSLTDHQLAPAAVFSSLALFNQLRLPLIMLPMVIGLVTDALQSLDRIERFLLAEDAVDVDAGGTDDIMVDIQDGSFTWEQSPSAKAAELSTKKKGAASKPKETPAEPAEKKPEQPPFVLSNITLQAGSSELVGVVGTVGAGKTSLLSAIAGDMRRTSGSLHIKGRRAYCAQLAWIQNATLRDNITFGQDFVQEKYDKVIKACSLTQDLLALPHGDLTEIGERGINLSGGQKQRVSLARAIYFDADLILLDDPLGAVDAHVSAHIMEHAVCGLLKDKCRILVTHQLHVLPRCDRIALMDNGKLVAIDTYEALMAGNATFQQMMLNVSSGERKEEEAAAPTDQAPEKPKAKQEIAKALMRVEDQEVQGISKEVYLDYWRSTGSVLFPPIVVILLLIAQGANIVTNLWLAWWSNNQYGLSNGTNIGIYCALGVTQASFMMASALGFTVFGTEASKIMLYRAVQGILKAPVSFFDTTPLGRIMNRFSKDVDVMDNQLTESMRTACMTVVTLLSIFILIISYYYYFAAALVPLCVCYFFVAAYYRRSALEIKRHESVLRSTVYSRFNEAIVGTPTIRAYGLQNTFATRLTDAIDDMDSAYYLTFANQRWVGVRVDVIGCIFLVVTGMLIVTNQFSVPPSISGLVLSYLVSITQTLLLAVRQVADALNNMNSVERIHYYASSVAEEAPAETVGVDLPVSWPDKGKISFRDVELRYREGLPLVLHNMSIEVQAGERLGIVGRTGAGKSSLVVALFRMTELAGGSILIDDVDISSIGLKDLRSRLSIIPQDPTMFRGTVRSNLDPFSEHTDLELWTALRHADLVSDEQPNQEKDQSNQNQNRRITLDTTVESDGSNFSVGQRQLMGLARAIVRNSRIIVCDEATSSIDLESDRKVQKAMAEGFKGKTVLCIAHRLKTIIGYDRICVVDDGHVGELGTPLELYDQGGKFHSMCDQSQITRDEIIKACETGVVIED